MPSLDDPFVPGPDALNSDPNVVKRINDINSAASQLMNTIRPAPMSVLSAVSGVSGVLSPPYWRRSYSFSFLKTVVIPLASNRRSIALRY